ncbi:MAG TPA: hypothetical protein VFS23_14245 [Vicinamibacterales bacterium]|nr:hypothetical protein [Vicinamibacterales bacterium]
MLSLLALLGLLAILVTAASTSQQTGGRSLGRVTLILFGIVGLMSLTLASPRFGNRLAATEGYWPVAGRIFLMLALTIGTPLLLSATAVRATMRAGSNWMLAIAAGVVAAIGGWVLGIITMFAIAWS